MTTGGLWISSHKKEVVHPYVRQDLSETKYISLYAWTQAVLGLSEKDIEERAAHIQRLRWFEDPIIRDALITFCATPPDARREVGRYQPFADIANRAFDLAKRHLPGVPESYPIDDICVVRNDPKHIQRIPEHELGAERSPDLLFIRGANKGKLEGDKPERLRWVDIFAWLEFKASTKDLMTTFNRESKEYGMRKIDEETLESRDTTPDTTPLKLLTAAGPTLETDASSTSLVGFKRSRGGTDDIDQRQNDNSGFNTKKKSLGYSLSDGRVDAKVQSGGYALETAACTYGTRSSCLGIVFDNDVMSPWYYDAAGYVSVNQNLSLVSDFPKVMAILVGFACLGHEKWGAIPAVISPPASAPYPTHFPPESLKDHSFDMVHPNSKRKVRVTLTKSLFTQYNLVGRRTFLYDIETNTVISKTPLVVKISYQVVTRKAEHVVLKLAKKAKVGHLPEVHMWGDLWKMSEGIRQTFYDLSSKTATFEDRVLRALVYTKYLPIKELFSKSPDLIFVMADQILDCLHDLRYKARILHRDISCNNIMYEIRDGRLYFILIDFDMATVVTSTGEPSAQVSAKHRTGTLPFMAFELLRDTTNDVARVKHRLRHDLESLLYVSCWSNISMPVVEDKALKSTLLKYLRTWEADTLESVASVKLSLLRDRDKVAALSYPPAGEHLRPVFDRWFKVFRRGYNRWSNLLDDLEDEDLEDEIPESDLDIETLNGTISRDTIKKAIAGGLAIAGLSLDTIARRYIATLNPSDSQHVDSEDSRDDKPVMKTARPTRRMQSDAPKKTPRSPKIAVANSTSRKQRDTTKKPATEKFNTAKKLEQTALPKQADAARTPRDRKGTTKGSKSNVVATRTMTTRSMVKSVSSKA